MLPPKVRKQSYGSESLELMQPLAKGFPITIPGHHRRSQQSSADRPPLNGSRRMGARLERSSRFAAERFVKGIQHSQGCTRERHLLLVLNFTGVLFGMGPKADQVVDRSGFVGRPADLGACSVIAIRCNRVDLAERIGGGSCDRETSLTCGGAEEPIPA